MQNPSKSRLNTFMISPTDTKGLSLKLTENETSRKNEKVFYLCCRLQAGGDGTVSCGPMAVAGSTCPACRACCRLRRLRDWRCCQGQGQGQGQHPGPSTGVHVGSPRLSAPIL